MGDFLHYDGRLEPALLKRFLELWRQGATRLMVGPKICDGMRGQHHCRQPGASLHQFWRSRLLISSDNTFSAASWPSLGPMFEWLVVDFVNHSWGLRIQLHGF